MVSQARRLLTGALVQLIEGSATLGSTIVGISALAGAVHIGLFGRLSADLHLHEESPGGGSPGLRCVSHL